MLFRSDGFIYANQWQTDLILKIDTGNSQVVKEFDLGPLAREIKKSYPKANVLNGIAYNSKTKDVFITGKFWPRMYVIKFKE